KDTQGNPVPGQTLIPTVSPDIGSGSISAVSNPSGGTYNFTFTSTTAGLKTVSVAVSGTPGPKAVSFLLAQTVQVVFAPGAANAGASTFTAAPTSISDDGVNGSTLTLTVRDVNNNPVPGF